MPEAEGLPPFPAAETLHAPPSWRCIDFVSDLHLHEDLPRTTQALRDYLRETPADAVLMLGDIFEAWVGDDMRTQPYEAACMRMLADAGTRLYLGLMVGNRDFLLGEAMLTDCHAHRLSDPTVLRAFGQNILLVHGDELCLDDPAYLSFRRQTRQPAWQSAFLAHPLENRLQQAKAMRTASQLHQQETLRTMAMWADVDEPLARDWMLAAKASVLVHGHTHRPGDQAFGPPGGVRHVLSDWDLDQASSPRAEIMRLTATGFERIPWAPRA